MRRPPLMPKDTPSYMEDAWAGCIEWAFSREDIRARFEADTGRKPEGRGYVKAFIIWVNENIWGPL